MKTAGIRVVLLAVPLFWAVSLLAQTRPTRPAASVPKPAGISNNSNAGARRMVPDGSWVYDYIDTNNPYAWFSVPVYYEHAYAIEVYVPYNTNDLSSASVGLELFESDGTTSIPGSDETHAQPSLEEFAFTAGGARLRFSNYSTDRYIRVVVGPCCFVQMPLTYFYVRMVDLTQTAARWTVNGYNAYIALNNTSGGTVTGYIDYFDSSGLLVDFDSFSISANGAAQFFRPSNVKLAGSALFGGLRIIPTTGSPGAITAQEYNYNPGIGQYLSFVFEPAPWQTAKGPVF